MIKKIIMDNINKAQDKLLNDLNNTNFTLDCYYIYITHKEPVDNKRYAIIKESITQEGLDAIIEKFQSFYFDENTQCISLGIEYQAQDLLPGARDFITINRAA